MIVRVQRTQKLQSGHREVNNIYSRRKELIVRIASYSSTVYCLFIVYYQLRNNGTRHQKKLTQGPNNRAQVEQK